MVRRSNYNTDETEPSEPVSVYETPEPVNGWDGNSYVSEEADTTPLTMPEPIAEIPAPKEQEAPKFEIPSIITDKDDASYFKKVSEVLFELLEEIDKNEGMSMGNERVFHDMTRNTSAKRYFYAMKDDAGAINWKR